MSFTVYRSSAGSGKTFTLVLEYLKIVLAEPRDFRHILAITFTNKSAAEMKDRVLEALQQLSTPENDGSLQQSHAILTAVKEQTGLDEATIAANARIALGLIMHHYDDFAIGTIDSFSHRIIRSFAHDFGLSIQFNVELDSDGLLRTAVDLLLDQVGSDKELTRLLVRFLESYMDEDKGWAIDDILVKFSKNLLNEEGHQQLRYIGDVPLSRYPEIFGLLRARQREFEKSITELGSSAVKLIESAGLTTSSFHNGQRGIYSWFSRMAKGEVGKLVPSKTVSDSVENDKWVSGKAVRSEADAIERIKPRLLACYNDIRALETHGLARYNFCSMLAETLFPLAVLAEIERVMTAFKKQNNLVHIAEFNRRISSVVMNEPVPFIYERLGEKYHHIMIDEFQDTSCLQWQNFVPLIENALASGYFNLVVGDGKQAIYRWRGGDVNQFTMLPHLEGGASDRIIRQRETVLKSHYEPQTLERNYRSRREIVEFNNSFFEFIAALCEGPTGEVYRDVVQKTREDKEGGLVSIKFLSNDKHDDTTSSDPKGGRDVLDIVMAVHEDGFQWRDIAVLCRTNDQASKVAGLLIGEGIRVISPESLLLSQSPKVRFLAGFIRFLHDPDNLVTQLELAGFLFRAGHFDSMDWPEILNILTARRANGAGLTGLFTRPGISFSRDELLSVPVYDLFESLIRTFGLAVEPDPYIQFFLDAVQEFSNETRPEINDFAEWWNQSGIKRSVILPSGLDAVTIMTIHQSKGLQFPVVILPLAKEQTKTTRDYLWVDLDGQDLPPLRRAILKPESIMERTDFKTQYLHEKEMTQLDQINLLYVAFTRPEERLYIISPSPPKSSDRATTGAAFLAGFLRASGVWEESRAEYLFGVPERLTSPKIHINGSIITTGQFISLPWRERIRIRARAPEMWDVEDPSMHFDFGAQVHALMARVKTTEDVEPAIREAIEGGMIKCSDETTIRDIVTQVVSHPLLSACFFSGARVKTEAGIIMPDGQILRPDRINLEDDKAVVVEYKTGHGTPQHAEQLSRYTGILKELGYREVSGILVYLRHRIEVIVC